MKFKILIVDDEKDMLILLKRTLEKKLNCKVESASNGETALELVKKKYFDLALIDIRMPGMDGIELLENIKNIVEKAGGKVSDIVKLTIYLTNIEDYGGMNEAFIDFFKSYEVEKNFPARSAVQVGPLMYREWFIEIEAVAIVK